MPHHVANKHAREGIRDLKDVEKITAHPRGGTKEMVKAQRTRLWGSTTRKSGIVLRQQRVLEFARSLQVLFQLYIFLTQRLRIGGQLLLRLLARGDVARRGH